MLCVFGELFYWKNFPFSEISSLFTIVETIREHPKVTRKFYFPKLSKSSAKFKDFKVCVWISLDSVRLGSIGLKSKTNLKRFWTASKETYFLFSSLTTNFAFSSGFRVWTPELTSFKSFSRPKFGLQSALNLKTLGHRRFTTFSAWNPLPCLQPFPEFSLSL